MDNNNSLNEVFSKDDKSMVKMARFVQKKQELRKKMALDLLDEEKQYFERIKNVMV